LIFNAQIFNVQSKEEETHPYQKPCSYERYDGSEAIEYCNSDVKGEEYDNSAFKVFTGKGNFYKRGGAPAKEANPPTMSITVPRTLRTSPTA
jgi:hypothetical protein